MDQIKQENKKNLPKFLLIMLGCALLGMVFGIVLPNMNMGELVQSLSGFFRATAVYYCPAVLLLLTLPAWLSGTARMRTQTEKSMCCWTRY